MKNSLERLGKLKDLEWDDKDPITMDKNATVKDALQIMKKHQIGGIPIVNSSEELIGIVTNRDLRFQKKVLKYLV